MTTAAMPDSHTTVSDEEGLVQAIGRKSPALDMKVIDHLDSSARTWVESAQLAFTTIANEEATRASLMMAKGIVASEQRLIVPLSNLEDSSVPGKGDAFGSLWLIPGLRETLRINGRIEELDESSITVIVSECYIHCGKALIRSDFWQAEPTLQPVEDLASIVANARFAAIATSNGAGEADMSPKGDPSGMMVQLIDGDLCIAERPGNRRADSLRNLLVQPRIALVLIVPGSNQIAMLSGSARITTAPAVIDKFTVRSKLPTLVVQVSNLTTEIVSSTVLQRVSVWSKKSEATDVDPAAIISVHIGESRAKGFAAWLLRTLVRRPGFVRKSLDSDYKKRLY